MTPSHKKPGVAFWATVALVTALVYPLSLGPLTWLHHHGLIPEWIMDGPVQMLYVPLIWLSKIGVKDGAPIPELNAFGRAIDWYVEFWR